jgi:hypothetical protein
MSPRLTSLFEQLARRKALVAMGAFALLVLAGVALSAPLSDVEKTDDAFVEGP